MAGIYDIVDALAAMGAELKAVSSDAEDATKNVKEYGRAVEEAKKKETAASMTDASPNRDRSRDRGAAAGDASGNSGKPAVTTTGLGAALASTRGRSSS